MVGRWYLVIFEAGIQNESWSTGNQVMKGYNIPIGIPLSLEFKSGNNGLNFLVYLLRGFSINEGDEFRVF